MHQQCLRRCLRKIKGIIIIQRRCAGRRGQCCRIMHWRHALTSNDHCQRKHDSMSNPSKRDDASGSARLRKSSTSRTRSPTHARKGSGVGGSGTSEPNWQEQHWRGQIIAVHARAPRCGIATPNRHPRSCKIRSALRSRVHCVQRVADATKESVRGGGKKSRYCKTDDPTPSPVLNLSMLC